MPEPTTSLIEGVVRYPLDVHGDERGEFVEIFRNQWIDNFAPVQWNFLRSAGNVLRGFHCHIRHTDLLAMVEGTMVLGLKDLRVESPTHGVSEVIVLRPTTELLMIPPGVGHGFYFPEPAMLVYSVSHVWSTEDELGCRWDDSALDLDWGAGSPTLSERDRTAGTLEDLQRVVHDRLERVSPRT